MIPSLMMCTSVVVLLVGMILGIVMGIQENFLFSPAHAHLNLVGGVLLFMFGLYYKVVPRAADMMLAKVQGSLAHHRWSAVSPGNSAGGEPGPLVRDRGRPGFPRRTDLYGFVRDCRDANR
jgi:hypothetical protein